MLSVYTWLGDSHDHASDGDHVDVPILEVSLDFCVTGISVNRLDMTSLDVLWCSRDIDSWSVNFTIHRVS